MARLAPTYLPREPHATVLYRLVKEHGAEFLRHARESNDGPLPRYVEPAPGARVWTRDRDRADRMARALEFGTVYMNRCDALDPALPWTGGKDSGRGVTLSSLGFDALTPRRRSTSG